MTAIEVTEVSKAFAIPSEHRATVREHVMGMLRRRRFEMLQVLDQISFTVERGESFGIMGRNGSGKSTLMKIISGVYQADSGRVAVNGQITPILELGVGWNPELDAYDNVWLIGSVMGLSMSEIRRSMQDILAFAELERFAHLPLKHYSSGMASRLGYAIAFRAVHEVLVLDEIFSVGDAGFRARCERRYRELRQSGHTAIIVSHDPNLISKFCDRALLLDSGRLVLLDRAEVVAKSYLQRLVTPEA